MPTVGKVTWFNDEYGFIETEDIQGIYVHYSAIKGNGFKSLNDGQKVAFDLVQGLKGPLAKNVIPINSN